MAASPQPINQTGFVLGHRRSPSDLDFQQKTRLDAKAAMHKELGKILHTYMGDKEPIQKEFDGFEALFDRYLHETGPSVDWEKIKLLPEGAVKPYAELESPAPGDIKALLDKLMVVKLNGGLGTGMGCTGPKSAISVKPYAELESPAPGDIKALLDKLVVVKLNGGLGTGMGCTGPKSAISVRNELTFLDLNVQQIEHMNKKYDADVPLVLMNSFNTDEDTEKILKKYNQVRVKIYTFRQSRYPRIEKESLLPIATNFGKESAEGWYPPGHGDIYISFYNSGLLDEFIKAGKTYMFVSNIDNLGATVDINILKLLLTPQNGPSPEFVMEVTDKTRADIKGGTLVDYNGKLRLLELAQVPKDHVDEFKSVTKFRIFNTNNLWMNLEAIKRVVEEKTLHMEIIINPKTLDSGTNVIQLETAVGAAIKSFDKALGINVPRSRFLPVKTTSDLLIIMSNLYSLRAGFLEMNPKRAFPSVPLSKLGSHFTKVKEFLSRFASIPDMLELDHLTVSGDVTFGKNVSLKGTVIIIANHGDRIDIPSGAILENKIVSGNLRILDH